MAEEEVSGEFKTPKETRAEEFIREIKKAIEDGVEEVLIVINDINLIENLKTWRSYRVSAGGSVIIETTKGTITIFPTHVKYIFPIKSSII
jgi:hypothetical protein